MNPSDAPSTAQDSPDAPAGREPQHLFDIIKRHTWLQWLLYWLFITVLGLRSAVAKYFDNDIEGISVSTDALVMWELLSLIHI